MALGYNGKILHVDLTNREWSIEEPDEAWYRTYWGGGCLASYYLLKMVGSGVEPLSPDNVLVFAASVLTGAPISGFSRYTVAAKSPLTNAFGESEAGGYFGPELKFSGFDAVIVKGRAEKPVYVWINNGQVEIRDAEAVWGLENGPALDSLRLEVGEPKARAATIGPAGEKQIIFANVMNEMAHANGRTGMGAVMGSKNLKAVICRGDSKNIRFADPEGVKAVAKWHNQRIKEHGPNQGLRENGTSNLVIGLNSAGGLPTRNWKEAVFEGAEKIGPAGLAKILIRGGTCYRCAVGCKRVVQVDEPYSVDPRYGGPEYETLAAFGSICGVDDIAAIAKANEICNRHGLDTISAGAAVAFAMECFEEGVLTAEDDGGRVTGFGDAEGMIRLVEQMVAGEGLGALLAKGVKHAAEEIGRGAERFAFHIKGQEIPYHDPRMKTGVGLSFAVSPTGADHIECPHESPFQGQGAAMVAPLGVTEAPDPYVLDEAKVRYFSKGQASWSMNNTLGLCNFTMGPLFAMRYSKLVEAVQAITGWETSLAELLEAGERSITLARLFNAVQGVDKGTDKLFRRLHEPVPEGPNKGAYIDRDDLDKALTLYYRMMGWDEEGVPTSARLHQLNLGGFTGALS